MIYAAILAGGTGSRMGNTERPKQFLEIGGRPIIVHTVEAFLGCPEIDRILVVTPAEWVDYTIDVMQEYFGHGARGAKLSHYPGDRADHESNQIIDMNQDQGCIYKAEIIHERETGVVKCDVSETSEKCILAGSCVINVLAGGATRNETLMNAIRRIDEEGALDDDTIIVTQDAVRPFVTEKMILDNIEAAKRTGACETAFPATDTIVESDDGRLVAGVPDRARLWMTQTPQSFRAKKLRELYESLSGDEKAVLTDAAKIFVIRGEPVEIVMGSRSNIKITYPEDLEMTEAILAARES